MKRETKIQVIFAVFMAMVPISVLISSKLTTFFGLSFTVGAYAYAVTFPCTDIIGECCGRKKAKQLVHLGLISYLLSVVFVTIGLATALPFTLFLI